MKKIMIKLIEAYQKNKNPYSKRCKYIPTCSNYAKEAYQKFNFFKASWLTFYRILRCNPFSKGGLDPVPLSKKEKLILKNSLKKSSEEGFDATAHIF